MKKQQGFTLIELMMTVALAAVLLGMGIPAYQDFVRNNRHATEVNNLISTLQVARSEAVVRNQLITVCPSTNGTGCTNNTEWESGWIVFIDANRNGAVDSGEEILRTAEGPKQMTVREANNRAIGYLPNGRVRTFPTDGNASNFVFCDQRGADHARVVQLEVAGRPQAAKKLINSSAPTCP